MSSIDLNLLGIIGPIIMNANPREAKNHTCHGKLFI